ncbi:ras guanine nucleotide exchange factor Y isoform X2 [Eupeodes corollae]|nr:ras guanine nucleotide exchange factor Y isoform X2 [Eupeodes corollae]
MHPLEENTIINGKQNDANISILPSSEQISVSQDDNLSSSAASSLTTSVNSKEDHLDGHHSDDSGISASSSPVNGTSTNNNNNNLNSSSNNNIVINEKKYIRPNGYNSIPSPPPQKILTRTVSTPQIFTPSRRITFGPASKGLMQRFIATRGKIALNNAAAVAAANSGNAAVGGVGGVGVPNSQSPITPSAPMISDFPRAATYIPPVTITPPIIERDADGKPIRRGYVPVEEKIQKELKDLKSRESELKKIRKIRQSTPDLLDSIENEELESDEDSDVEHCYGPGKLRSAKSIGELCDSSNNSLSPRATPSPDFDSKHLYSRNGGMRPALSLAQLCDLDPQEAPSSSHQLIAKWESLIQQNA